MEEGTFREKLRLSIIITVYSLVNLIIFLLLAPLCFALSPMLSRIFYGPVSYPIHKSEPVFITEIPYLVYDIEWQDKDQLLKIKSASTDKFSSDEPDLITEYNLQTDEFSSYEAPDKPPASYERNDFLMQTLGKDYSGSWTTCEKNNLIVIVQEREPHQYWLTYWINEELQGEHYFYSEQWYDPISGEASMSSVVPTLSLSPTCEYVTMQLYGWRWYEAYGDEELWMLDVAENTFERIVIGRSPNIKIADYSVQSVEPAWAPDGQSFLYGSGYYGLDLYNVQSGRHRLFTNGIFNLNTPKWSPSGKWVAAEQWGLMNSRLYVFSANGKRFAFIDKCDLVLNYEWADAEDTLAFSCNKECENTCPNLENENSIEECSVECNCGYDTDSDFIYLWNFGE